MHNLVIVILLITSIVAITFIIERGLALRWRRVIPQPSKPRRDPVARQRTCQR
jgi:hypothetical protein